MKTQTITQKNALKTLGLFGLFIMLSLTAMAQERTVTGVITDEDGPVEGATVILKGTSVYVDTDETGAFTFPQKLKENDALVVSLIGYEKQEVTIGPDTSAVEILMDDYAIVVVGSLLIGDNNTCTKGENQ